MRHKKTAPFQAIKTTSPFSNIPINIRLLLVCFLTFAPSIVLIFTIINRFSDAEQTRKRATEQTITAVAEQYMNTSVENIVSIAKTIYTNSALYNFLNTAYPSTTDYYDAFYALNNNNSLIIADNPNIQSFTVYTDNNTILSGGNISSLAKVKDQAWYQEFQRLNKSMILYCDTETLTLSLLRRLDYSTITTGECIMKIDINGASVQAFFEGLHFDGNIYVMSDGALFYSNITGIGKTDAQIDSSYSCLTKNYYTVSIEYYARANKEDLIGFIKQNLLYGIPFLLFYTLSVIVTFFLMRNVSTRITRLTNCYTTNGSFHQIKDDKSGKDEIGQLHGCCVDLSYQLERMLHEGMALDTQLERFRKENDALLLQALHQDAVLSFRTLRTENAMLPLPPPDVPVPIAEELQRLRDCLPQLKSDAQNQLSLRLELADTGQSTILPLSLVLLAQEVINAAKSVEEPVSLCLSVASVGGDCSLILRSSETKTAASRLLKLRAIFEGERKTASWNFQSGYPYNPYLRLKEYYRSSITCSIETAPTLTMTLTLHAPKPAPTATT